MKKFKKLSVKILAVLMSLAMLSGFATFSFAAIAADVSNIDYTIQDPYQNVDWQTWGQYKVNLHCHTLVSDGTMNFNDVIEKHYELGYDALAITDHGTTDYGWVTPNVLPMFKIFSKIKAKDLSSKVTGLTQERYEEITTPGADGKTMIRIPYGIENNPTSLNNAHVNSWFAPYGDGVLGGTSDYERPLKGVEEAGGLSVINHPGEYTSAKNESNPELAYNEDYSYYIKKFTNLLLKYHSCIGIDINSKTDNRTKNDRKLWDILLKNCIPQGRSVFAIGSSDAHRLSAIDSGWTVHLMPNLTVDDLRTSMETGAFFAGSRFIKNTKELAEIGAAIGEDLGSEWSVPTDAGIVQPKVTSISVSQAEDSITINTKNARLVRWIADGEQIATGSTIKLDDYSDKIGSYVRAEIFGNGGILYSQAFVLKYDNSPKAESSGFFYDFGKLISVFRDTLLKALDKLPLWENFWELLTNHKTQV